MVRGILGLVLLCSGCSTLLGFEDLHAIDAAQPDGPVDAAIDTAIGCDAGVASVNVVEDTMIVPQSGDPNPSIRFGANTGINLGLNGTSRLLLRFDLASVPAVTSALATTTGSITATLTLHFYMSGNATTFQIYALSDGWNEGTGNYYGASWYQRIGIDSGNQTPWQVQGADGLNDRSQLALATRVATAAEATAGSQLQVTFSLDGAARTEALGRLSSNRLSLILVPTSGGQLFVAAREGMPTGTQLAFSLCP